MLKGDRRFVIHSSDSDLLSRSESGQGGDESRPSRHPGVVLPAAGVPSMKRFCVGLIAAAVALGPSARAADETPAKPPVSTDADLQKTKQAAAFEQERLRRQFSE